MISLASPIVRSAVAEQSFDRLVVLQSSLYAEMVKGIPTGKIRYQVTMVPARVGDDGVSLVYAMDLVFTTTSDDLLALGQGHTEIADALTALEKAVVVVRNDNLAKAQAVAADQAAAAAAAVADASVSVK